MTACVLLLMLIVYSQGASEVASALHGHRLTEATACFVLLQVARLTRGLLFVVAKPAAAGASVPSATVRHQPWQAARQPGLQQAHP